MRERNFVNTVMGSDQIAGVEWSESHHAMLGTPTVDGGSRCSGSLVGSDSDSGSSIFITQKNPVRTRRQRRCGSKLTNRNDKKREKRVKLPAFTFYHLQEGKQISHVLNNSQNIHFHNALMGGFFNSVKALQACEAPDLLSSLPTVDQEGDFIAPISEQEDILEEEDIQVKKKKDLVVFSKTKRPQPWYIPPRANLQIDGATTSRKRFGGAPRSGSTNGNSPENMQTGSNQSRIQAEASKTKGNGVSEREEMQDESAGDSDSDATFCELLEGGAQNDGGAQLHGDEQEEHEAQGDDFESHEEKSKDLNVTLDQTEQVESGTCLETPDKRIKKKKRPQSESEDICTDVSFSDDAIGLSQELFENNSLDGHTIDDAEDRDSQLVSEKKKKTRHQSENEETCIESQDDGFESQKKKSKYLNVTLDQIEQVESGTCLETPDKRIKKKKKRRRSENEEICTDVSCSIDTISLSQELMVETNSSDERIPDDNQLVTQEKKRRQSESEKTSIQAPGEDFKNQKKKSKYLNVTLDQTEQVESGTCLETTDKRIKKKKKKRRQSESGEPCTDVSFSIDAISLPASQEVTVEKNSLDGHTVEDAEDKDSQLVSEKKKRRRSESEETCTDVRFSDDAIGLSQELFENNSLDGHTIDDTEDRDSRLVSEKKKKKKHWSENEETCTQSQDDGFESQKKRSKDLNVTLDQTEQVESGTCLETPDKIIKKKKKKKRHQSESEETCIETRDDGFESQKKKSKNVNVTSDQIEQVESGTCLETSDERIKKKRRRQSKSEEICTDVSFTNDTISLSQELMVKTNSSDGRIPDDPEDNQLVTQEKKRRQSESEETSIQALGDIKNQKKKTKDLNVTLDQTEQVGGSGTCLETTDKRIKKKKKKRRQSESGEPCTDVSFSIDAISLPLSQESTVEKNSLDGHTVEDAEDKDSQLVTKKRKKKKRRHWSESEETSIEARGDDFTNRKKNSNDLIVTLDQTESGTCLETTDKRIKKKKKRHQSESEETCIETRDDGFESQKKKSKDDQIESGTCLETSHERIKKKKRHQSKSEETCTDVSFTIDAISSLASQELIRNNSLDGHTVEGAEDKYTHLVPEKKKKKKKKRRQSESEETYTYARGDDSNNQGKKSKDLNMTLDQTEQVGGSGTCLETTDKRIKKKKVRQSKSEETCIDVSFSQDAISLNQELIQTRRLDGHAADKDSELVTKKKEMKRRKKRRLILNPCRDAVTQSDESESVWNTGERKKRTSSFPTADAGTSASDSAEIGKQKKKKRKKRDTGSLPPAALQEASLSVSKRKKKRALHNPSEDFLTN